MEKRKIRSLKDLHREKERLRSSTKKSRELAEQKLKATRKGLSKFLLTRVALPAGALGVTAFGISKYRNSGKASSKSQKKTEKNLLSQLMPVIVQALKLSSKLRPK